MHVETYSLPHAWYRRTSLFLTRHEAENNLLLGLAYTLMNDPGAFAEFYLAAIVDDEQVVGAAVMTIPHNLILARTDHPGALDALAGSVYRMQRSIPGVNGPKTQAHEFARIWTARTGERHELEMPQRIYELREVTHPTGVAGTFRAAVPDDIALMAEWQYQFSVDAHMEGSRERSRIWAAHIFSTNLRRIFFWEVDGQPVSMAGATGRTPNGIRIGPVFTPAEHRGHGYASACTAAISQKMLDEGRKSCFLFTDLGNPTSNKIYQQIGYVPVTDIDVIRFQTGIA